MQDNDNSVNINTVKRAYHHGDLRSALVEEGLRLLVVNDVESLSLREIARHVGVSATAIYRHFPDKDALLSALAAAGYAQLGVEQMAAAQAAKQAGAATGFAASGQAYVRFAIANPALFRLMFATSPARARPGLEAPKGSPAWLLQQGVVEAIGADAPPDQMFIGMMQAWSLVHGLAMLILDEQVDPNIAGGMIDQIISPVGLNLAVD